MKLTPTRSCHIRTLSHLSAISFVMHLCRADDTARRMTGFTTLRCDMIVNKYCINLTLKLVCSSYLCRLSQLCAREMSAGDVTVYRTSKIVVDILNISQLKFRFAIRKCCSQEKPFVSAAAMRILSSRYTGTTVTAAVAVGVGAEGTGANSPWLATSARTPWGAP